MAPEPEDGPAGGSRTEKPHSEDGWTEERIEATNQAKVTNPRPYSYPVLEGKTTAQIVEDDLSPE